MNQAGVRLLKQFLDVPSREKAHALTSVPVIFRLLEKEYESKRQYRPEVLQLCTWMHSRSTAVLVEILRNHTIDIPRIENVPNVNERKWELVRIKI